MRTLWPASLLWLLCGQQIKHSIFLEGVVKQKHFKNRDGSVILEFGVEMWAYALLMQKWNTPLEGGGESILKVQNRGRKNKLHAKLKISDLFPKMKPTIDQAEAAAVQSDVSSVAFRCGNKCCPIELLLAQSLKGNTKLCLFR